MAFHVVRFPEWKTLYDAVLPLLEQGQKDFDYDVLSTLARIDVRSDAGRSQFYRFRRQLLRDKQLWLENVPGYGYTLIPAGDQPKAAVRRVQHAKRKVKMAKEINGYARIEQLTPEQRVIQAATAAVLHNLSKHFLAVGRQCRMISTAAQKRLPIDLQKLITSISKPVGEIQS